MTDVQAASFADLDTGTLYALLRLRVDVFVVEQDCAYPELDGRDTDPRTRHFWTADGSGPSAYLRVLVEDGPSPSYRIGRVCTRADARGSGRAAVLLRAALQHTGAGVVVLDAQSHLTGWYETFGFVVDGAEFTEDDVVHTPMRSRRMP